MLTYVDHPATVSRTIPPKNSRPEKRAQLLARWTTVNGKLICQWIPERSMLEQ